MLVQEMLLPVPSPATACYCPCRAEQARLQALVQELRESNRKLEESAKREAAWAAGTSSGLVASQRVGPLTQQVGGGEWGLSHSR